MSMLLAELATPPLQPGPVRWPEARPRRPRPLQHSPAPSPTPTGAAPVSADGSTATTTTAVPWIQGRLPYGAAVVRQILEPCLGEGEQPLNLDTCALLLNRQLQEDGYLESQVRAEPQPAPGRLQVRPARISSLRVQGPDQRLNRLAARWLQSLRQSEFHQPTLATRLDQLREHDHIATVQAQIGKADPTDGSMTLDIEIEPLRSSYAGEMALSDEGDPETGELKAEFELEGTGIVHSGDTLFLYAEVNTNASDLGYTDVSLSYETSLSDNLRFSSGLGVSTNNLIAGAFAGLDEPETQLEWEHELELRLLERPTSQLAFHVAIDLDRTLTTTTDGFSDFNGYLRLGLRTSHTGAGWGWSAMLYGLQAIANSQEPELVGTARALGGWASGRVDLGEDVTLRLRGAGQLALAELTPAMDFSLGSDIGLRGLPGEVISGDNGLIGSAEIEWSIWRPGEQVWQVVPFLGAGRVGRDGDWDSLGSTGVLLRWLSGNGWTVEVGALHQFGSDALADWQPRLLGRAITSRLIFRF